MAFARRQLGKAYCRGGVGPRCFDCSGLTYAAYRAAGKTIPRTSAMQKKKLTPVAFSQLRLGDILWRPGHVGLYVGAGRVIHAPQSGQTVRYQAASKYRRAVRP